MLKLKHIGPDLKTFYNGKKVPLIPPLQIGNTLVSNFKMKANIFIKFFASQCVPLNNGSNIPYRQRYMANGNICSIKIVWIKITFFKQCVSIIL